MHEPDDVLEERSEDLSQGISGRGAEAMVHWRSVATYMAMSFVLKLESDLAECNSFGV